MMLLLAVLFCASASADPLKPQWPWVFDAPFGLALSAPGYPDWVNVTSHFYSNWNLRSQLITYPERCIPLGQKSLGNFPCDVLFNATGVILRAPKYGLPCCLAIPGIGSTEPDFLKTFAFQGYALATDMYGKSHNTTYWLSDSGFASWMDVDSNQDVFFRDGPPGGPTWAWGWRGQQNAAQNADLYQFEGPCTTPCPSAVRSSPLLRSIVEATRKTRF